MRPFCNVALLMIPSLASGQLKTETLTAQSPLTATGATVLATGATVTFPLQLTTFLVSIGPGTIVTLTGSLSPSSTSQTPSSMTGISEPAGTNGPSLSDCRVYGDTDIIGLGVRLGLYFQLLSNIIVVYKNTREGIASIMLTNIFMTAVFVAIVFSVAHGSATPSELIVFMWYAILEGCPLFAIAAVLGAIPKTEYGDISFWTLGTIVMRLVAFNAFYLWFWFHGLTVPNALQCNMEPRVFLFANLGAYGNVRTALKVFSVLFGIIPAAAILFLSLPFLGREIRKTLARIGWLNTLENRYTQSQAAHRIAALNADYRRRIQALNRDYNELYNALISNPYTRIIDFGKTKHIELDIYLSFVLPSVILLGLVIMAIELEVRWNDFKDVNSMTTSGQIIPLTIGACSLLRAIALLVGILKGEREEAPRELPPDEGQPIL